MMKQMINSIISTSLVTAMVFTTSFPEAKVSAEEARNPEYYYNLDTDGDGLTDIHELLILNPTKKDTDNDGVLDGDEDTDQDGLTNIEEQKYQTKLNEKDSDGDGLDDPAELTKYNTNPNVTDTDGDGLHDGVEVLELKLDPTNPDQDRDGKRDGDQKREYEFPENTYNLTGQMSGTSNVTKKVVVREVPNLLLQRLETEQAFDIVSMDPTIEFKVTIPYNSKTKKEDLELFRYDEKEAKLLPVSRQKLNKQANVIEAAFAGGGSFFVISKQSWKDSLHTEKKLEKKASKKFNGKAKLSGFPGILIDSTEVQTDDTFTIKKTIELKGDLISLDDESTDKEAKDTITRKSTYKVSDVYQDDDGYYITAQAIGIESGHVPVILVHGLTGGADTWGFEDPWIHTSVELPYAERMQNPTFW